MHMWNTYLCVCIVIASINRRRYTTKDYRRLRKRKTGPKRISNQPIKYKLYTPKQQIITEVSSSCNRHLKVEQGSLWMWRAIYERSALFLVYNNWEWDNHLQWDYCVTGCADPVKSPGFCGHNLQSFVLDITRYYRKFHNKSENVVGLIVTASLYKIIPARVGVESSITISVVSTAFNISIKNKTRSKTVTCESRICCVCNYLGLCNTKLCMHHSVWQWSKILISSENHRCSIEYGCMYVKYKCFKESVP